MGTAWVYVLAMQLLNNYGQKRPSTEKWLWGKEKKRDQPFTSFLRAMD